MFEISASIWKEFLCSILVIATGLVFFRLVSSHLTESISCLVERLKKIDKLIKSGKPLVISYRVDDKNTGDPKLRTKTKVKNPPPFLQEILSYLDLVLNKGINQAVREQEKILFFKKQLLDYLSFLKERSYFFTIFKNKILLMLVSCLLIRWGVILIVRPGNFNGSYTGIDIFFIISVIVSLIFIATKIKKRLNQSFIAEDLTRVKEWMGLYFYKGFSDTGIKALLTEPRSELASHILKMHQKQIKEGVSYSQDIEEYLEEWLMGMIEKEKNKFYQTVEFFPLVELGVVGGSVFMLLSVPICSII